MSVIDNLDSSLKGQSSQAQAHIIGNLLTTEPGWNVALIAYALSIVKTEAMEQLMLLQRKVFDASSSTIQTPSHPAKSISPDDPQQSVSSTVEAPIKDQSGE